MNILPKTDLFFYFLPCCLSIKLQMDKKRENTINTDRTTQVLYSNYFQAIEWVCDEQTKV